MHKKWGQTLSLWQRDKTGNSLECEELTQTLTVLLFRKLRILFPLVVYK